MASPARVDDDPDPRITEEYIRHVAGGPGTLTLIGVVHDHPASIYRTQQLITACKPTVLALELPPISIPLFEAYAATERTPPVFGGEMSAAIQAASSAAVVGIDRPTGGFFTRLAKELFQERPTAKTVRNVLSNTLATTKHAVRCRAAASLATRTAVRLEVDSPVVYDIDWTDPPAAQAADERNQVRRSRSFMHAFRTSNRSRATQLEDAAREAAMATRLVSLREQGDVVAVVGIDHLDALTERLDAETQTP